MTTDQKQPQFLPMSLQPSTIYQEQNAPTDNDNDRDLCDFNLVDEIRRWAGEMMVIRTLQRFAGPIFVPIFRPLIRQMVEERLEVAEQKLLAIMKENTSNSTRASSSVLRKLKLKFRNRISVPVFSGIPLLGENQTPIEIVLVDALTEQVVNTGAESTAKLEIMGFRVSDDDGDGSLTVEELQERVMSERKGRRILQGNTCLQLKQGVGFVHEIRITHDSKHTKKGLYRLVAVVVDAGLMKQVEVAWTEPFFVKDKRQFTYRGKHQTPSLSDEVCVLKQIGYKGPRLENLRRAKVKTVKDLLILLYNDPKQLETILELNASSKRWVEIVENAQASNGMFLYIDPDSEGTSGVVLDVKRQLKAVIVEPHLYVPVNHLSDQLKVEAQKLVKFASENLEMLDCFEDETSLRKKLESGSAMVTNGPPGTASQLAEACSNGSNPALLITPKSSLGKEKVLFDDEMIYSTSYYHEHVSSPPPGLVTSNRLNFMSVTEPGSCCQTANISCSMEEIRAFLLDSPVNECLATASVFTIAQTRWLKVSKLLRRNSVRERIGFSQGIQPLKKQRCC